jgi:hypothetical protein
MTERGGVPRRRTGSGKVGKGQMYSATWTKVEEEEEEEEDPPPPLSSSPAG